MADAAIDLSMIFERLSTHSRRPRFAFMVLNLLSEAADSRGRAGPLVTHNGETLPVRMWLGGTLARMGDKHRRRADMRRRVAAAIEQATPEIENGGAIAPPTEEDLDKAVEERARNDLGMIAANETFYQVVDASHSAPDGEPAAPASMQAQITR